MAGLIDQREANNTPFRARLNDFHALRIRAIGERVSLAHVREMLIQHILTEQIVRDLLVYTPSGVRRFIIQGCDPLVRIHFGRGLADEGLDILDPCTGTGTFIVELLDLRGDRKGLARKFAG